MGSTLIQNLDALYSIDIAPSQTFQATQTYELPAGDFYNWPDDTELWVRITKAPNGTFPTQSVNTWIQPGANAAPPTSVGIAGGVNATELQSYPISTIPPASNQGLIWNATTNSWTPTTLNPTGDVIGGIPGALQVRGLYGNPIGNATPPTPGQVLTGLSGAQTGQWGPLTPTTGGPPSGPAGGDLANTYPNPAVTGIEGYPINASGIQAGSVLEFNGSSNWLMATRLPRVISFASQFAPPTVAAGGANEIMNNGNSIPNAYNQGLYRLTGYLNITVSTNITIITSVIDALGVRITFTPQWQLQNSSFQQTMSGYSASPTVWNMIPVTFYQAPGGIGGRVIISMGSTTPGTIASLALEQLTTS